MKVQKNNQHVLFGGIFILANKLQYVADRKVEGLSTKQWFLLRTLQDMPEESDITSLAKETDTTRQNTTKMLEILCREGYVNMTDSPRDRRSSIVELTGQGREMLRFKAVESADFFRELFSDISDSECEAAAKVVIKMIETLNNMQEDMK